MLLRALNFRVTPYCVEFYSGSKGCNIVGSYYMAIGSDDNYYASGNDNNGNVCGDTAGSTFPLIHFS